MTPEELKQARETALAAADDAYRDHQLHMKVLAESAHVALQHVAIGASHIDIASRRADEPLLRAVKELGRLLLWLQKINHTHTTVIETHAKLGRLDGVSDERRVAAYRKRAKKE